MKNRWNDQAAREFIRTYKSWGADVALRTYTARLIGQETDLVLHGGGNTSVKTVVTSIVGDPTKVLCIKGSGWDLDTIEPAGHPSVSLNPLLLLRKLPRLSDEEMVNVLRCNMLDSAGPNPSVEALLHAFLPHKFIDHTHADAVLSLVNQRDGLKRARDWVKGRMGVVPYIMPGFALAQLAARIYEQNPRVEGLILYKHGIFTFGDTAKESYDRMIYWVDSAENVLNKSRPFSLTPLARPSSPFLTVASASNILRGLYGRPAIVRFRSTSATAPFVNSREAAVLSQVGPATPDHVIRTKPKPLYLPVNGLANVNDLRKRAEKEFIKFKRVYDAYVDRSLQRKKIGRTRLDPLPRVAIVPGLGIFSLADSAKAADIALDIYEHTINVIMNASRIGRYEALSDGDLFDMEYWSLEQAKLGKSASKPFTGKIVWVSGAASGIGFATAAAFARQGAHVYATDIHQDRLIAAAASLEHGRQIATAQCDVTNEKKVQESFERCSELFGGVDIVISNAGIATTSAMKDCDSKILRQSFEINFFSHQNVAKAAAAVFERQRRGDALLFNASKSTFNPGPDFGPYTLPKTAVIGLMKQYAIELGDLGVRCNAVNADRVRTRLFDEGLLKKRAKARGVTIEKYLAGNILGQEVFADDVAQAFVALALAQKTTGATLPVDGGNAAAFPR